MNTARIIGKCLLPALALMVLGFSGCEPKRPPVHWSDTLAVLQKLLGRVSLFG
jgi:hypothetical protein